MPEEADRIPMNYKTARLLDTRIETRDVKTHVFAVEENREFTFTPGQFNMLGFPGVEEAPISMSSLSRPGENLVSHTIRTVGNVTSLTDSLDPGGKIMLRGPFGRGWPLSELRGRDVLLIGGGIGLAPLRPLLMHCLEQRENLDHLVLVYGAKSMSDMVFQKDLENWQEGEEVRTVFCADRLEKGKKHSLDIQEGMVPAFLEGLGLDRGNTVVCACGPEIMMRFVARKLLQEGYASPRVYLGLERRMRCGTAHCGHCQIGSRFVCRDGPVFSYADISRFADVIL